ncbi:hypothetical protein Tco_0130248, partial [Tanacetum coccineum]
LQNIGSKSGGWDQFGSKNIATALICLSTTENKNLFVPVLLTKKIFGNMKRSFQEIHRPLLPAMLTIDAGQPQPSVAPTPTPPIPSTPPSTQPPLLT